MKNIFFAIILFSGIITAQDFTVEKVSGIVNVLKGTNENWEVVKVGQSLNSSDLLSTDEKSFIQLNKSGNKFILQSNSALGLNHLKNVSLNDLLLALAMEEIKRIPKSNNGGNSQNTAVYGKEVDRGNSLFANNNELGSKLINGAKQLAESGYKESAIIAAKEIFRKHPSTKKEINNRIYFANILLELKLNEEALQEFNSILDETNKTDLSNSIMEKINGIKSNIVE